MTPRGVFEGRYASNTYMNVQQGVNPRHKEDGTGGALCAHMLRSMAQRESVDPHDLKAI